MQSAAASHLSNYYGERHPGRTEGAFLGNGSSSKTIALFCRANSSATCHKELSSISLELYGTVSWQRRRRDARAAGWLSRSSSMDNVCLPELLTRIVQHFHRLLCTTIDLL